MADVILIEATPRSLGDGAPVTVRLAGGGADRPYHYAGAHWRAGVAALPALARSLAFDGVTLGGGGVPTSARIDWRPATALALAEMASLYWIDAPVTVRVGPEGDALPPIAVAGLVLAAPVEAGTLSIALADQAADLKRPLLVDRFAGTGGIEGPTDMAGRIKPRAWGRCFNVRGWLLDKTANVWCFGDPARPWQAIDAVRERGVAADPVHQLAWQGSVAATFAALRDAVAPEGGCVVCPSIACVKWWTRPTGDLHIDLRGETTGGYVETAAEIAQRVVAARSALAFAAGAVAAAAAARPAPVGLLVADESTTAASAISGLLAEVSTSWLLDAGAIDFRHWQWSAAVRQARSHRVTRREVMKPVATRRLGWRRNCAPMQRSDLAESVLAKDVVYADGSPIEEWKPAEPGATKGAPVGTTVGGKPVTELLTDITTNSASMVRLGADFGVYKQSIDPLLYGADGTPIVQQVQEIGVKTERFDGFYRQMTRVDPVTGTVMAMASVNANGVVSSFTQQAGPGGSITGFFSDIFVFWDRNGGGPPIEVLKYEAGRWKMTSIEVDTIKARSIITDSVLPGAISGLEAHSAPDKLVSGGETVLIEVTGVVLGDGQDGRGVANLSFIQDGTSQVDTGMMLRFYIDSGSGWTMVSQQPSGIRVNGGDAYWILPVALPIALLSSGTIAIRVTAAPTKISNSGNLNSSWARNIQLVIFKGYR